MVLISNFYIDQLLRILWGLATLLASTIVYYVYRGYNVRKMFRRLHKEGVVSLVKALTTYYWSGTAISLSLCLPNAQQPLMRHSMILGHLETIGKLMSALPSDAHGDYMMMKIQENWRELFPGFLKCPPVVYIDLWPFASPMMISINPAVSAQFTQDHSLPKAHQQKRVLYPLTRNRDVASMEGLEWKIWRKRLNPGFSIQNITSRVPDMLEEVEDFVKVLRSRGGPDGAWGPVFPLEEATTNLAMDVILRFFLNERFHEQAGKRSAMSVALLDTISRMYFYVHIGNIISYLSPWRHFKLWRNYRILSKSLTPFIQERVVELKQNQQATNKTLVDLIVQSQDGGEGECATGSALLFDNDFLNVAIGQITTFLFAGHDTTATTICWLFHLLSQHPKVLARVRAEHDAILGPDTRQAASTLKENPQLLNSLTYTHAVLKESMRVHTNVGSMRRGEPGFFLVGPPGSGPGCEGKRFPTEGFIVWDGTFAIHRDPELWHRANEFVPERFLTTDENDLLRPPKNAWRFFELGPRGCIGQHLAIVEIKLVMALVARSFDIECAWDEWDHNRNNRNGAPSMVWNDRCYQVGADTPPHVKDGMPVHVRLRGQDLELDAKHDQDRKKGPFNPT